MTLFPVIVKAWIQKGNRFLVAKRGSHESHLPGSWTLPGGKVEASGETEHVLETTLQKEILEEVGVNITNDIRLIYDNSFFRSDGVHVINLTFLCVWKSGDAKPLEDTDEIRWLTIAELQSFAPLPDFLKKEILILQTFLKKYYLESIGS